MKTIYVVRHTTPKIKSGICYGNSDINVADSYHEELAVIKTFLKDYSPQLIYSSPLKRCSMLAKSLFINEEIKFDDRLKELNFGDWEMKAWSEIDRETIDSWSNNFVDKAPPLGESFQELYDRVNLFWNDLISNSTNQDSICLVTHSGVMRCLLSKFLSIPLDKIFRLKLNFGAVIKITLHPDFEEIELIKNH